MRDKNPASLHSNLQLLQEPEPDWFEQRRLTAEFNKRNSSEIETPGRVI